MFMTTNALVITVLVVWGVYLGIVLTRWYQSPAQTIKRIKNRRKPSRLRCLLRKCK